MAAGAGLQHPLNTEQTGITVGTAKASLLDFKEVDRRANRFALRAFAIFMGVAFTVAYVGELIA
jgi:hypothetical protein